MTIDVAPRNFTADDFLAATGVSRETCDRLTRYADELATWQGRMNLVSPRTLPEVWHRHMLDSAQLVPLVTELRTQKGRPLVWLDIGSGGGFPALVIAIMTGEEVHLVEKSPRKGQFLRAMAKELAPAARIHTARVEEVAKNPALPAPDVVTARACAPLPRLLEMAYPFLQKGAQGLFLKGQHLDDELTEATKCWRMRTATLPSLTSPGGRILRVEEISYD